MDCLRNVAVSEQTAGWVQEHWEEAEAEADGPVLACEEPVPALPAERCWVKHGEAECSRPPGNEEWEEQGTRAGHC